MPKMTQAEMEAQIAQLQAENAALKKTSEGKLTMKVSEKGAVSVYGLGRFPVTLYPFAKDDAQGEDPTRGQWGRLLQAAPAVLEFISVHRAELLARQAQAGKVIETPKPPATVEGKVVPTTLAKVNRIASR